VWLQFDPITLELGPFWWYGGSPGEQLPDITGFPVAKHTKGNSKGEKTERPDLRVLTRARFQRVESAKELVEKLFGTTG
jgi:hypothetical protein